MRTTCCHAGRSRESKPLPVVNRRAASDALEGLLNRMPAIIPDVMGEWHGGASTPGLSKQSCRSPRWDDGGLQASVYLRIISAFRLSPSPPSPPSPPSSFSQDLTCGAHCVSANPDVTWLLRCAPLRQ